MRCDSCGRETGPLLYCRRCDSPLIVGFGLILAAVVMFVVSL